MFDRSDETIPVPRRRVEAFTEPERRRDWPDKRKIAIVAESLAPGVIISALARSHGLNPQQLFGWRKRFRREASALTISPESTPAFAPAIVEPAPSSGVEHQADVPIPLVTDRDREPQLAASRFGSSSLVHPRTNDAEFELGDAALHAEQ